MAGIDNLKDRILRDDSEKAAKIIEEANSKANEVIESAKIKSNNILNEMKIKSEKDGKDKKERLIARAQLDARNIVLSAKQEAIENIFQIALKKIQEMNNIEYSSLIEKMIINNTESGDEEIIFSQRDISRIEPELVDKVNSRLKSLGKVGQLTIKNGLQTVPSGFILKKGELEINCSIESQIRMLRENLESEIADFLFSGR